MLWPHHSWLLRKMSLTSWVIMMIVTVWISVPCAHEHHAAATPLPSNLSADFSPSESDPALSGSGHLGSSLPPPESVDHADGTSGSSGEIEPWISPGDPFKETDMLGGGGAREDEPKAETSSGDVRVPEEPLGGHTETVMVEKREDRGAGAVSPVTQKSLYGTLATGETVSSLLPDGQPMTSAEPTDRTKETGGNEKKSDKNDNSSSVTPLHDGENLITDGKEYGPTTKKNGSATGSSPPDKWSGSTPVDPASSSSSSSSDSESKVSAGENPVQASAVPAGPSLPLHSPKPSAEDSPTDDPANETSIVTMNTPTTDHPVVTKREFSANHWSPMTGHSDEPVFDPSSSGNPETFTFSKAPTELLTTAGDLFTTKLDTSRSDRSSPDFKVTSDEALMSSGSRTRRETRFTDGETMQHTTADFSSTLPSNMESTSVVKSTLLPTASAGSQMTSGELSDFPTASLVGTTAMVQTSPFPGVGMPCVSNQSCYHLGHAVCLEGTCSCTSGYYGDLDSDSCFQEPYGLTVTADNKMCLNLRWDGGDHEYNVTVTSSVSQDATQSEVTKSKDLQMCHFSPGALLTVSVVLNVGGEAETASLVLEPEAPTHVAVSSVNHTCLTVTWRPGPGHTDLYILNVSYAIGESISTTTTTTTQTTWTDCGLAPGTSFLVEVFSSSHGKSSQTQGYIDPDSTVPSQPVDGVGQRSDADPSHCVDLQWTAGPGHRDRFHLAGPTSVDNTTTTTTTTTNSTAATVCSLEPGSLYTFSISASSKERYSQPLVVDACTDPEAAWNLRTQQVEATSVTLVWDPPFRGVAVTYVIRGNHSDDNYAARPDQTSATVTGLMSGTIYSFSLTAEFCNRTSLALPLTVRTSFSALTWANLSAEGRTLKVMWETEQGGDVPIWLTVQYRRLTVFREVVHTSPQFIHTNYSGACFNISLQVANRSQVTTIVESTEPAAPDEVRNLQAQRLPHDRRALNVTWSPPAVTNGIISHYNVSVRGQRGFKKTSRLWHCQRHCDLDCHASAKSPDVPTEGDVNDEHWVEVDELSEYEDYKVVVTAYTSAGGGPSSSVLVEGQLLDKVMDLRVDTLNASCLTLTWFQPENAQAALTYHVDYQPSRDHHHDNDNDIDNNSGDSSGPVNLTLSDTRGQLCGLQYWTSYQVNVTAVDDQGPGKTDTRRQRTAEHVPGAVANVSVSVETSIYEPRRLDVRWAPPVHPYGLIRNYFITVRNLNTSELIERQHPGHQQSGGLSGTRFNQSFSLVADHHYRVQVFGATGAGNGSTVERALVMPAGVLPASRDTVKFSNLDPGVTSLQAKIPTSLLCNFNYGMPVHAGYIVFKSGETLTGISSKGVSLGHTPVVTSPWTPSHTSFYVDMDVLSLCPSATHGGRYLTVPLEDESCGKGGQKNGGGQKTPPRCSSPLAPSTRYHLLVVYCTSRACTYTLPAPAFTTPSQPEEEDSSATGLAAGVTVVSLLLLLGAVAAFYWVYKKKQRSRSAVIPLRSPEETECRETVCKSRPVALERFLEHVQQLHRDSNLGFSEEYKIIKDNSPSYSVRAAELTPCKPKNRYTNILPWDRSRVKLIPTDDEEGSDYINASYLPGENHQREFIAAQGPLPSTVDDFWRMVWENRVCVVVMLTQCIEKGKTKCEKYWPDEGVQTMYGDLMVQVRSQSVLPDYIIRVIDVKLGNQSRMIKHFHFMRWPDHGCPEKTSMLLNFVSSVRAHMPHSGAGPTLVHCSAGVGRTGTFIALDRLLLQIRQRSHVDIFNLVFAMREHRTQMVQNENQYVYIHDCLADALTKDQESDDEESEDDEDEHVYGNC